MNTFFTRLVLGFIIYQLTFLPLQAQMEVLWDKTYGGNRNSELVKVLSISGNRLLLAGNSAAEASGNKSAELFGVTDYWLVMTDLAGNKLWDKSYGGDDYEKFTSVISLADGGFLLGGYSKSGISGNKSQEERSTRDFDTDMWVVRIDAAGNILWDKTYGGNLDDYLSAIQPTEDGGFLLGGYSASPVSFERTAALRGGYDYWLLKIDASGNKVWDKAYGGNSSDLWVTSLVKAGDGYLIGGTSYSGISGEKTEASRGGNDYWIVKVDASGNKMWDKTYGGSGIDQLSSVIALDDGGFLIGGISESDISGDKTEAGKGSHDFWVLRLDATGNKIWDHTYGGEEAERITAMRAMPEGGFLLGGESSSGVSGDKTTSSEGWTDFWLLRIDENGGIVWDQSIGGNNFDNLSDIVPVDDGLLLAGSSSSDISGDKTAQRYTGDYWLVKVRLEGQGPLSGVYTIGGENSDFGNFRAALAALESQGITGPVTFKVRPGAYVEQLEIDPFPGNSCSHPVIFEGEGNAAAQVVLQSPEGSDFTVQVNGADGIRFRNLSFVKKVEIGPGSDCFQFEENVIAGPVQAISSATERNHQHIYSNNIFQSSGITIINEAPWNPAEPIFDEGLIIEGNDFRGLGNITVEGQRDFTISHNIIPELRQESNGITVTNSWFGGAISENRISVSTDDYKGTAILLNNSAAAEIRGNKISLTEGGVGLRISTGRSTDNEILIANNIIDVSGYDARGINYFPISNLVGLDIDNPFPNNVKIFHNNLKVSGYSENVPNYTLSVRGENNSFRILNNVIANGSYGTGVIVGGGSVAQMDYNNLYMDYADLFASYGGNPINSLAEWRNLSPFGTNSISVNPWLSPGPAEEMKGAGIFVEEVPYDFYGQQRNNPPTIGAVESERTTAPLSGIYTIGGENPDFARFSDAIGALENKGVADSVLFKVRPGEYHEQLNLSLSLVQGRKVIFEGESADSTDVVLNYPLDEVLVVQGGSNYTFRHLTFASGIRLSNSRNLLFENNVIVGGVSASIVSNDAYRNNLFQEKGIRKYGEGVVSQGGRYFFNADGPVVISDNIFNVQDEAINLYAQANVEISHNRITLDTEGAVPSASTAIRIHSNEEIKAITNNTIVSMLPNTTGISLDGIYFAGDLPKELTHNKIELQQGGTAIAIGYSGANSADGLIANNMISVNAIDQSTGISFSFIPGNVHIYSNNIALYGEGNNSRVLYFGGDIEKDIILYNNILANLAGGKVFEGDYFQYSPLKIAESDFNNLYTSGDIFAHWEEGAIPSLSAWVSATRFDSHSFSVNPEFESVLNLIPDNAVLDGAGIALTGVETDFFGVTRSYPPDIGAVEFEPGMGEPEAPEPTNGFVLGGAVFHSPAGAITYDPMAEGRAILSFHAEQKMGEERPKGVASLTIPTEGFRFKSVNAWEWMSVDEHTAILQGTGAMNREEGYRFLISVADNGTGPAEPKDTYRMIIWNPDGEVVYDNQPELGLYTVASMPIERGNIMVGRELRANARLSQTPSVEGTSIQEFKAYPTLLEGNYLWVEVPEHEFPGEGELELSILDRQGRIMTTGFLSRPGKQKLTLNSGDWAPGIYLLIIRGNGQQFQQKLVKQE